MCIGAPALVLEVDYDSMTAVVDFGDGVSRKVLLGISEERVNRGDIVMVHAGVIVSKVGLIELTEQVEFFRELLGPDAEPLISNLIALIKRVKEVT